MREMSELGTGGIEVNLSKTGGFQDERSRWRRLYSIPDSGV